MMKDHLVKVIFLIVLDSMISIICNNHKVLPREIGVISPYRRQVEKIKSLMNRRFQNGGGKTPSGKIFEGVPENWNEVTVGSTEEFQGQERRVIIITTVRSQPELLQHDFTHKLGFLRNPKRSV